MAAVARGRRQLAAGGALPDRLHPHAHNVDALELARRFHDDVRARVPEIEPLPEPMPTGPATLF
jgi:hypothetical protein